MRWKKTVSNVLSSPFPYDGGSWQNGAPGKMPNHQQSAKQTTFTLGQSAEGRDLIVQANFDLHEQPAPAGITLLLGGTHGDEPATTQLLLRFKMEYLATRKVTAPTIIWPTVNPDGMAKSTRYNARGVDLNRNNEYGWRAAQEGEEPSGDAPWSEPESRALRNLILLWRPVKIVTLHWALAEFDADGPQSLPLLDAMWNALSDADRLPYRRRHSPVPTAEALPGSLGGWCGFGLKYPAGNAPAIVTLELPFDPAVPRGEELPSGHLDRCKARWRADSSGYLAGVRPAVFKALCAACELE
jgi:murein peptide amidase A